MLLARRRSQEQKYRRSPEIRIHQFSYLVMCAAGLRQGKGRLTAAELFMVDVGVMSVLDTWLPLATIVQFVTSCI